MPKFEFVKGEQDIILPVYIQDSSAQDGSGLADLDEGSSITGFYVQRNGLGIALTVNQNVTTEGTYQAPSTVGQVRIGTPANAPDGFYELHFHNDLFAGAGKDWVTIGLGGASNMATLAIEVQLVANDPNTTGVTLRDNAITLAKFDESTAWPLVAADSGATQVARVGADGDTLETLSDQIDNTSTHDAADAAGAVWNEAKTGHTDAGKAGEQLWTDIDAILADTNELQGDDVPGLINTVQNDLDILTGSDGAILDTTQSNYAPAKAGDEMAIVNGSIKLATYDGSTAFPLVAVDSGATQVARVGADGDTLKDLSDNLAVIESELDGLIVTVGTAGAGLADLGGMSASMKEEVNEQVLDVFAVDVFAQPSGVLSATASLKDMLVWIAVMNRNKLIATGSDLSLRNDADGADIAVAPISSVGSETIRGEFV